MRLLLVAAMIGLAAPAGVGHAQHGDDEELLRRLWIDPDSLAGRFSDRFLGQVPLARLAGIIGDLAARCGALRAVGRGARPNRFVLATDGCEIPVTLRRDHEGKVAGLWFAPPRRAVALPQALEAIARFDGSVSYAVVRNGALIAGLAEDEPLAVGSAFKLIVLAALLDRIDAKEADWSDTLALSPHHISLPTGRLRKMPPGAPITLHTLATFMIAESDNTAADALIAHLGRDRLEALGGPTPFLTTREFFLLKSDETLYGRYAAADTAGRRALLETAAGMPLPPVEATLRPFRQHAEWHLSTADLCAWMGKVAHLEIMWINPGPLEPSRWRRVAFKGGSEIGVLNLTAQVRDEAGRDFCVSATWNAPGPIDEGPLAGLYASLFLSLAATP